MVASEDFCLNLYCTTGSIVRSKNTLLEPPLQEPVIYRKALNINRLVMHLDLCTPHQINWQGKEGREL